MSKITMAHLSTSQRKVAELIGLNNYLKLVKEYGHENKLYLPKYSTLKNAARNEMVRAEFNGYNHSELAVKYDLSTRTIYSMVYDLAPERKGAQIPGQIEWP